MNPAEKKKLESESKLGLEPVKLTKSMGITSAQWKTLIEKEQKKPGSGYKRVIGLFDSKEGFDQELKEKKKVFANQDNVSSVKPKL